MASVLGILLSLIYSYVNKINLKSNFQSPLFILILAIQFTVVVIFIFRGNNVYRETITQEESFVRKNKAKFICYLKGIKEKPSND